MTFEEACDFVMDRGKYRNRTLSEIGESDDGLKYLDWMSDKDIPEGLSTAIETYLSHPPIARDLERLLEDD